MLWEWSTHLDYLGGAAHPWPGIEDNLKALEFPRGEYGTEKFHLYVSGDPSVNPQGTPCPKRKSLHVLNLVVAQKAALVALRAEAGALSRQGRKRADFFRAVAGGMGVSHQALAQHFEVNASAISHACLSPRAARPGVQRLKAALELLLSDPRMSKLWDGF